MKCPVLRSSFSQINHAKDADFVIYKLQVLFNLLSQQHQDYNNSDPKVLNSPKLVILLILQQILTFSSTEITQNRGDIYFGYFSIQKRR